MSHCKTASVRYAHWEVNGDVLETDDRYEVLDLLGSGAVSQSECK